MCVLSSPSRSEGQGCSVYDLSMARDQTSRFLIPLLALLAPRSPLSKNAAHSGPIVLRGDPIMSSTKASKQGAEQEPVKGSCIKLGTTQAPGLRMDGVRGLLCPIVVAVVELCAFLCECSS